MSFFAVHSPIVDADRIHVQFDVVPIQFVLLQKATTELVGQFLALYGIETKVLSYEIEHQASPYYSDDVSQSSLPDVARQFFRIRALVSAPIEAEIRPFGRKFSDETDPTFLPGPDDPDPMDWTSLPCVVVGDWFLQMPDRSAIADVLGVPVSSVEVLERGSKIWQARVHIGVVDAQRVDAIRAAAAQLATICQSVSFRTSVTQFAALQA